MIIEHSTSIPTPSTSDAPKACCICNHQVSGLNHQNHMGRHILHKLRGVDEDLSGESVGLVCGQPSLSCFTHFSWTGIFGLSMWVLRSIKSEWCVPNTDRQWESDVNLLARIQLQDQCSIQDLKKQAMYQCSNEMSILR